MLPFFVQAFNDELEKIARVPKAVKQYRRALEALQRRNALFHGTKPERLGSILKSRELRPSSGTYGHGAYLWDGRPRNDFMRFPAGERHPLGLPGVWAKKKKLKLGKTPTPPSNAPVRDADRRFMQISEDPVRLPPRTTVNADARQLQEFREAIRKGRFRQIDSRIWHRAEADLQMRKMDRLHDTDHYRRPTKKELVRLLRSKKPMPYVGMTRDVPRTPKALNDLYGTYDQALGREVSRDAKGAFEYF